MGHIRDWSGFLNIVKMLSGLAFVHNICEKLGLPLPMPSMLFGINPHVPVISSDMC